jgi:hypothetical protein
VPPLHQSSSKGLLATFLAPMPHHGRAIFTRRARLKRPGSGIHVKDRIVFSEIYPVHHGDELWQKQDGKSGGPPSNYADGDKPESLPASSCKRSKVGRPSIFANDRIRKMARVAA